MLAATSMGYDSCPISGFDFKAMGELINLPPDHVIVMSVAIGKGLQPAGSRSGQLPLAEVVFDNGF
jgi:nitroreductase